MDLLKDLIISGRIRLLPLESSTCLPKRSHTILMLGETGVGKSNFLECLHGDQSLRISGNRLEPVTQDVTAYELINARYKPRWDFLDGIAKHIILIDTPGLGDPQMSETKTVKMIQEWQRQGRARDELIYIDAIWYFHRITDKRLAGSQRQLASLARALLGEGGLTKMFIITTMWDTLWTDLQLSQATARFDSLVKQHWQDAALILKFYNTHESSLEVLRTRCYPNDSIASITKVPPIHRTIIGSLDKSQMNCARILYMLTHQRIEQLRQRICILDDDLEQSDMENDELRTRTINDKSKACALVLELEDEAKLLYPATFPDAKGISTSNTGALRKTILRHWKRLTEKGDMS